MEEITNNENSNISSNIDNDFIDNNNNDDFIDDNYSNNIFIPDIDENSLDNISWPPRPSIPPFCDLYDTIKSFILDQSKNEYIFPPMLDGNERKIVHNVAELFGLKSKSFGRKSNRHVRLYKYDDVPTSIETSLENVRKSNTNYHMKELKIPICIKEHKECIKEEILLQDKDFIKRILVQGNGDIPCVGNEVYVHYEGYYEDGGVFDSTRVREKEFHFILGDGQVIPAWDIAIGTMQVGELVEIIVPPKYGFGILGCPPRIPANTIIKYEIELLRFSIPQSITKDNKKILSVDEAIESSISARYEGNTLMKVSSCRKASKSYNRAFHFLERLKNMSEQEEVKVNEAKIPILSNLALCYLKLKDYKRVITNCEKLLSIDNNHSKGLCRMGEAQLRLGEYNTAYKYIIKVYNHDEKDTKVKSLLREIQQLKKEEKERHKNMFKGVLS